MPSDDALQYFLSQMAAGLAVETISRSARVKGSLLGQEMRKQDAGIQVVREVPLWGVITALAFMFMQLLLLFFYGGQFYRQQEEQGKSVAALVVGQESIKAQLATLSSDGAVRAAKDAEHDRRISDLEARFRFASPPREFQRP